MKKDLFEKKISEDEGGSGLVVKKPAIKKRKIIGIAVFGVLAITPRNYQKIEIVFEMI